MIDGPMYNVHNTGLKLQLAIVSTFVYFYVYTSLKVPTTATHPGRMQSQDILTHIPRHTYTQTPQRAYARLLKRPVTFLPNLALNSLAGVANILLTLPLDVVVTRMQVAPQGKQRPTFREMVRVIWEEGGAAAARARKGAPGPVGAHEVLFWRLTRFWHGLLPALILTSNPAINYACYDALKAVVPIPPGKKRHGPREMFVIGMLSKFVATVITYPLIRAKVMMMADTKRLRAPPANKQQHQQQDEEAADAAEAEAEVGGFQDEEEGGATAAAGSAMAAAFSSSASPTTSSASPPSPTPSVGPAFSSPGSGGAGSTPSALSPSLQLMAEERQGLLEIMRQLVREGGVSELYVGLDGQIINTALKNAVLMNTKDRISRVTAFLLRRLFGAAAP